MEVLPTFWRKMTRTSDYLQLVELHWPQGKSWNREKDDIVGAVKVPGISGDTYVHIPAVTGSHRKMRLIGKGVKRLHSIGHGEQIRLKEQSLKYFYSFVLMCPTNIHG
ncbi:hypothetical protein GCK72_007275 [Caenorhabditis remanei]|uniref:Chaperone DnaJ C-terminal domain-containing protein n=1 Tax=Caenorhabditis remanei TaxID=31234 RepID=A0A6A5HKW3_CAERE|nr:hypothetical protein GCK72_007275 [Caenorhabditis remanei]KAF1767316.1 hypothetical protein GCK72_007275 [Caenorhabditis remanei]